MVFVEWSDELSVNVPKLDEQHKMLIQMINELQNAMVQNKSNEIMAKTIRKLVLYTQTHFKLEEDLMKRYDDPELELHTQQHQDFIQKILIFQRQYEEDSASLTEDILNFLISWLTNHIKKVDIRYAAVLADKAI